MELIKVDGHTGLARDVATGAIVNINKREIEAARERKLKKLETKKRDQQLVNQVVALETEVADIKTILTKILEKL